MKVSLIGSCYMADEATPHLIVSYKMYDMLLKNPSLKLTEIICCGETAAEAEENIFKNYGLEVPKCPNCYKELK